MHDPDRRAFLEGLPLAAAMLALPLAPARAEEAEPSPRPHPPVKRVVARVGPRQDPAVVREVVGVSHRDLARVRELVERQPALANATIDWGFGDWESALGAASHVGRRDCRAADRPRRAAVHLLGGDAGATRRRAGVRCRQPGHPADARPAWSDAAVARPSRWRGRGRGRESTWSRLVAPTSGRRRLRSSRPSATRWSASMASAPAPAIAS